MLVRKISRRPCLPLILGGVLMSAALMAHSQTDSENVSKIAVESPAASVTSASIASPVIETQTCPESFYDIKLPTNGKLCQVFATEFPASMIFFVPQSPSEVVAFYQQDPATFSTKKHVKQRYMLQSGDKNTTLIISNDGKGTQVDVLVIGEQKT